MTWVRDIRQSGRFIYDAPDHTSVEIEWWYVGNADAPRSCAIELQYFGPLSKHSHTESFYFDQYSICLQVADELIECFSDDIKREELLETLRIKEVL